MTETIEVKYKAIEELGKIVYHKYIVYTNSSGEKFFARGGPAFGDGYAARGGDTSSIPAGENRGKPGQYIIN